MPQLALAGDSSRPSLQRVRRPLQGTRKPSFSLVGNLALLVIPAGILAYYAIFAYTIYVGAVAILAIIGLALTPRSGVPIRPLLPLLLLYGWWWITVLWTPQPGEAAFFLGVVGIYLTYSWLSLVFKRNFGDGFALKLMMACAFAFILCALYAYLEVGTLVDEQKGSVRSIFASFFVVSLPASTFYALKKRSLASIALLIVTVFIGLQLGSRTFVVLSIPAVLLSVMAVNRGSEFIRVAKYPILILVGAATAIIVVQALAVSGTSFELFGRQTSLAIDEAVFWEARTSSQGEDDLARRLLIVVGLDSFYASPIGGGGYLSTPFYMTAYSHAELGAHGFPLFLLGETGLVGSALFVLALSLSIAGFYRFAKRTQGEQADITWIELITLIVIVADGMFHQVYNNFYFYLFIGLGLLRFQQSRWRSTRAGVAQRSSHPQSKEALRVA